MKKILTIIGERPQFIKSSVVSKDIQETATRNLGRAVQDEQSLYGGGGGGGGGVAAKRVADQLKNKS